MAKDHQKNNDQRIKCPPHQIYKLKCQIDKKKIVEDILELHEVGAHEELEE